MKMIKYISSGLIMMLVLGGLIFTSCSKDTTETEPTTKSYASCEGCHTDYDHLMKYILLTLQRQLVDVEEKHPITNLTTGFIWVVLDMKHINNQVTMTLGV